MFYEHKRFIDEVLIGKEYEGNVKDVGLYDAHDLTVLDLGCNIGTFSLYIYDKAKIIYAVDLSPNCIALLTKTIKYNNFTKIIPICKAIAGDNKRVNVDGFDSTAGGNCIYGPEENADAISIETLMNDLNIDTIDLLKMDIEGTEKEIFESEAFKRVMPRIKAIIGEMHQSYTPTVPVNYVKD
jgi:FkbM family methyltransferase